MLKRIFSIEANGRGMRREKIREKREVSSSARSDVVVRCGSKERNERN